jgi:hypothetical protein
MFWLKGGFVDVVVVDGIVSFWRFHLRHHAFFWQGLWNILSHWRLRFRVRWMDEVAVAQQLSYLEREIGYRCDNLML